MKQSKLEKLCAELGLKMTEQRRIIARVLSLSKDHPDVEEVYRRSMKVDDKISLAQLYSAFDRFSQTHCQKGDINTVSDI